MQKRTPIRSKKLRNAARGQRCTLNVSGKLSVETLMSRFLEKCIPEPNSGCWIWIGRDNQKEYGSMWNGERSEYAHRLSYRLHKGEIPDGMVVCHICDVPSCVNPSHLWVGTTSDNVRDCITKGRRNPGDISGEKNPRARLSAEQVVAIRATPQKYGVDIAFARRFGVSKGAIAHVRAGRTWAK